MNVLAPKCITESVQFIGVTSGAEVNSSATIRVCLYLSLPDSGPREDGEETDESENLHLIQQTDLTVKIAPQYGYHDDASLLLVTNPATPSDLFEALRTFIETGLKLKLDVWNLGLYGGFQIPSEADGGESRMIISSYAGKSIIFLGNNFDYFELGSRNSLLLCDASDVAQSCLAGASGLFLGYSGREYHNRLVPFVFPVPYSLVDPTKFLRDTTHFSTRKELLKAIRQQLNVGVPAFTTYTLTVKSTRGGKEANTNKEAETVVEELRSEMPQERFLVSYIHSIPSSQNSDMTDLRKVKNDTGLVVVYHGLPRSKSIRMAESHPIQHIQIAVDPQEESHNVSSLGQVRDRPTTKPNLDPFDAYMVVASLPLITRVSILFSSGDSSGNDQPQYALFVQQACELSLIEDLYEEVALLLDSTPFLDSLGLHKHQDSHILSLHFPRFAALLKHHDLQARATIPDSVLKILRYTLAAAYPSKKRHVVNGVVPANQRTRIRQFLAKVIDAVLSRKGLSHTIPDFHTEAKKAASQLKDTIAQDVSKLTRRSEYECKKCRCSTVDVAPQTIYCNSRDWDLRAEELEKTRKKIADDLVKAKDVLGGMTDM